MKIYDCFMFFNELDLLEIRLNIFKDKVDKFVIVEQNTTHQGQKKESIFLNNKERFSWISDKIIHLIVDGSIYTKDQVTSEKALENENKHRNGIKSVVNYCEDDDIILISDLDEFPDLDQELKIGHCFIHQTYQYNFNNKCIYPPDLKNWKGTVVVNKNILLRTNPQDWRNNRSILPKILGGWHFTYFGGKDKILQKLNSFCHPEVNNLNTLDRFDEKLKNNEDILSWFRGVTKFLVVSDQEANLPEYVIKNKNKYKELFI